MPSVGTVILDNKAITFNSNYTKKAANYNYPNFRSPNLATKNIKFEVSTIIVRYETENNTKHVGYFDSKRQKKPYV